MKKSTFYVLLATVFLTLTLPGLLWGMMLAALLNTMFVFPLPVACFIGLGALCLHQAEVADLEEAMAKYYPK